MLEQDLRLALDPAVFFEALGMKPDPWQLAVLRSGSPRLLLLCARQSGKSTVAGAIATHAALYREGALVLLLSPSLRQSQELFRKVLTFLRAVPGVVSVAEESALRVELASGSRIVSLPGTETTVRGFSGVNLILVDEAARVDDGLYQAARPMLAVSGGQLVAMSTPWGRRGWYWQEWSEGEGWERVRVPAQECRRISKAFLEEERRSLGEWIFRQEYECQFVAEADAYFNADAIERALSSDVKPLVV